MADIKQFPMRSDSSPKVPPPVKPWPPIQRLRESAGQYLDGAITGLELINNICYGLADMNPNDPDVIEQLATVLARLPKER